MASITELDKGKYKLFVELGYDSRGKRIRKTKTVHAGGIREAKRLLSEFEVEMQNKTYIPNNNLAFGSFVEKWKTSYRDTELAFVTIDTYERTLTNNILPYFSNMKLKKISVYDITKYFNEEKANNRGALQTKYFILKSIFKYAVIWKDIEHNPMDHVKKPKSPQTKYNFYDINEIDVLTQKMKIQSLEHQVIIRLAFTAALRRSEIIGISGDVLDFKNNQIHIRQTVQYTRNKGVYLKGTKTENERTVTIPNYLMDMLRKLHTRQLELKLSMGNLWTGFYDSEGNEKIMLFANEYGKPIMPAAVTKMWNRFLKRTDLKPIRFHDLRHSSVSIMVSEGININTVKNRLGHKDIKTTLNIYSHVSENDDKKASDVFERFNN